MALSDYITEMRIYSSLESLADRCEVVLVIKPGDSDFSSLPAVGAAYAPSLSINGQPFSFAGTVVERDFQFDISAGTYAVTLYLYEAAMWAMMEAHYSAPTTFNVYGVDEALRRITEIVPSVPVTWNLPQYQLFAPYMTAGGVNLSGKILEVLRSLAEIASVSEIQKVVIYESGGGIYVGILDLNASRITGITFNTERILSVGISEVTLPDIRKAVLWGALNWTATLDLSAQTTSYRSVDEDTGEETTITTTRTFERGSSNAPGELPWAKVKSVTVQTSSRAGTSEEPVLLTRERTDYIYISSFSNVLRRETSTVERKMSGSTALYTAMTIKTRYEYASQNRLRMKTIDIREYDEAGTWTKASKEVAQYISLADGVTQVRNSRYKGTVGTSTIYPYPQIVVSYDLKSSTVETYYGPPPTGEEGPPGVVSTSASQYQHKLKFYVSGNMAGETVEYSNPHWTDDELQIIADQLRELDRAKRVDVNVTILGDFTVKKGNAYKIKDVRTSTDIHDTASGMLNFRAIEVNHEVIVGEGYTTTIRGVCYET